MKTFRNTSGFHEMEKREGSLKKYPSYKENNRNCHIYKRNNYKNIQNNQLRSFSHLNFNKSRDKSVKYNSSKIPYIMHKKPQYNTSTCSKEAAPWSEEALELERKQHLSDTANKLLNKIKMWNSENGYRKECGTSCNERTNRVLLSKPEQESNLFVKGRNEEVEQLHHNEKEKNLNEIHRKKNNKINYENVRFSSKNIQSKSSLKKSPSTVSVNKQKKIQQNIIGELMTMPKENLNKVLVNPKINPKIEKEMAQIVKENRLILAQKFRHLAESKINSQGQFQFQSKFIVDVENLIDPDLAIDLCQLPPELIKQMGDIFQLDFDSCFKSAELQEDIDSCNAAYEDNIGDTMNCIDSVMSSSTTVAESRDRNDFERIDVKVESQQENIIENAEIQEQKVGKISVRNFANCGNENQVRIDPSSGIGCNGKSKSDLSPVDEKRFTSIFHKSAAKISKSFQRRQEQCNSNFDSDSVSNQFATCRSDVYNLVKDCTIRQLQNYSKKTEMPTAERTIKQEHYSENIVCHENGKLETEGISSDEERRKNGCAENEKNLKRKSSEVQTDINLIDLDRSTGFQKNQHEVVDRSLILQEVDMIDNLIHILNQRRFLLFLKLVNLNSCKSTNGLKKKLIQAVTNCDATVLKKKWKRKKHECSKSDIMQSGNRREKQGNLLKKERSEMHQSSKLQMKMESDSDIMII